MTSMYVSQSCAFLYSPSTGIIHPEILLGLRIRLIKLLPSQDPGESVRFELNQDLTSPKRLNALASECIYIPSVTLVSKLTSGDRIKYHEFCTM